MTRRCYPRHTNDFDLLVESRHRLRWDQLIQELGYRPKHAHMVFRMYQSETPGCPPVDLMLVDHDTFEKFEVDATESTMHGMSVRIPALLHLVALKLHAERCGGEGRQGRDLNDVTMLLKLNHVDLADPSLQAILNRYGNDEIRRRLAASFEGHLPRFRPADSGRVSAELP